MREPDWWKKAVFYQIYPRSFADSNGDGIGDLPGIISKLDYLQSLGIGAVWLSPHYPSPQVDCGYDIANYCAVAQEYGNLDDFKTMLAELHQRGMALILDLVLNHTSDQHAWFIESRSSRTNPRRDWYIWMDGRDGGPPNNWRSTFGGSAWELDPLTGQYYYHYFFKEQPDLNWRNPEVKQALFDVVRYWLDLGVDGFRLDAIGTLFEDPLMPDHLSTTSEADLYRLSRSIKSEADHTAFKDEFNAIFHHQYDQPGMHELMKELRQVVDEYDHRILVGETDLVDFHGNGDDELHMVFNFPLMRNGPLTPALVRANQQVRLTSLPDGAWPCNTLGNHDSPRVYNQYGDGLHDAQLARVHLALLVTLKGTPFLYNGEEIGMRDYFVTRLDQIRDKVGLWQYQLEISDLGSTPEDALAYAARSCRDKNRTPMQWANKPNGGFSPPGVETWLPVNPDYAGGINVAEEDTDPGSLLNFYRTVLNIRWASPALLLGDYREVDAGCEDVLAYDRILKSYETCRVILNMSASGQEIRMQSPTARVLYSSTGRIGALSLIRMILQPFEVLFLGLRSA